MVAVAVPAALVVVTAATTTAAAVVAVAAAATDLLVAIIIASIERIIDNTSIISNIIIVNNNGGDSLLKLNELFSNTYRTICYPFFIPTMENFVFHPFFSRNLLSKSWQKDFFPWPIHESYFPNYMSNAVLFHYWDHHQVHHPQLLLQVVVVVVAYILVNRYGRNPNVLALR